MKRKWQVKPHYNVNMGDNGCLSLSVTIPTTEQGLKDLIAACTEKLEYLANNRRWRQTQEKQKKLTASERVSVKGTPQLQLFAGVAEYGQDSRGVYVDVYLSDYNHDKVKKTIKPLSPYRWAEGVNLVLRPGHGEGLILIGGNPFKVDYAWGGRTKPTKVEYDWNGRAKRNNSKEYSCYTVRLRGQFSHETMRTIVDRINQHEAQSTGGAFIKRIETDMI